MVDPVTQADRDAFNRRLKLGVAALVGVSMAFVAVSAGATLLQAAGAGVAGLAVGAVIAWQFVPSRPPPAERQSTDLDNPFADGGRGDERSGDDRENGPSGGEQRRNDRDADADGRRSTAERGREK